MSEKMQFNLGDVKKGDKTTFELTNGLTIVNEVEIDGPMWFDEAENPEFRVVKAWVNDELRIDFTKNNNEKE